MATDIHAHWLSGSLLKACRDEAVWQGMEMSRSAAGLPMATTEGKAFPVASSDIHFAGLDSRAEILRSQGIDRQVLSPLPRLYRYDLSATEATRNCIELNDALAEELRDRSDDTFMGLGLLPMQDPDSAVRELERCMRDLGLLGVALGTNIAGSRWEDPRLVTVLECARENGAVILMHPSAVSGHPHSGSYYMKNLYSNPADTTIALQNLVFTGTLARVEGLKLVLAHGGGYGAMAAGRMEHGWSVRPETSTDLDVSPLEVLTRIFVDTVVHSEAALRLILEVYGPNQVILGTDFPADMGLPEPVAFVERALAQDPTARDAVLEDNFRQLVAARPTSTP